LKLNAPAYADKMSEIRLHSAASATTYNWCLSFVLNSLVINGICPRAGFLQGLTVGIAKQAIRGGLCSSAAFKTSKTYFVQTLALDSGARKLLKDYLESLRPLVARTDSLEDSELFFLNSQGAPLHDTSRTVSTLWEASFGRKMTITVLRSA
jgi:hypothetical protein